MKLADQIEALLKDAASVESSGAPELSLLRTRATALEQEALACEDAYRAGVIHLASGADGATTIAPLRTQAEVLREAAEVVRDRMAGHVEGINARLQGLRYELGALQSQAAGLEEARSWLSGASPADAHVADFLDKALAASTEDFSDAVAFTAAHSGARGLRLWYTRRLQPLSMPAESAVQAVIGQRAA